MWSHWPLKYRSFILQWTNWLLTQQKTFLPGQWHWFVRLTTGIESNKAPRREKIKEVHCTSINSPFNYFIKWPSERLSDCLAWIQVRGETKWPSLRAGNQHSYSTVYWYTLGHWLCVCVFVCVAVLVAATGMPLSAPTGGRCGDSRAEGQHRACVKTPPDTHKHAHESAHNGHPVSRLCFWELQS